MSKSDPIEKALDRLAELRHRDPSPQHTEEIRRFLTHKSNLVAAKAANLVKEQRRSEFVPDLVSAFQRFIANPAQLDVPPLPESLKRCMSWTILSPIFTSVGCVMFRWKRHLGRR